MHLVLVILIIATAIYRIHLVWVNRKYVETWGVLEWEVCLLHTPYTGKVGHQVPDSSII